MRFDIHDMINHEAEIIYNGLTQMVARDHPDKKINYVEVSKLLAAALAQAHIFLKQKELFQEFYNWAIKTSEQTDTEAAQQKEPR